MRQLLQHRLNSCRHVWLLLSQSRIRFRIPILSRTRKSLLSSSRSEARSQKTRYTHSAHPLLKGWLRIRYPVLLSHWKEVFRTESLHYDWLRLLIPPLRLLQTQLLLLLQTQPSLFQLLRILLSLLLRPQTRLSLFLLLRTLLSLRLPRQPLQRLLLLPVLLLLLPLLPVLPPAPWLPLLPWPELPLLLPAVQLSRHLLPYQKQIQSFPAASSMRSPEKPPEIAWSSSY